MANNNDKKYFAAKDGVDTASILLQKADMWFLGLDTNGYLSKLRTMFAAYYGAYYTDGADAHSVSFGGEQGELTQIAVNHLRNLCQHMLTMITSSRPAMQARAINTDYKSLVQTKLANGLLDYYLREKHLEDYLKKAVECSIVLGSGYIKMDWNSTSGEVYDFNEELGIEEREGDLEFTNLSPFDVIFDSTREDQKHDWVLCRSWKNRHDVIAKYPEYEDEILRLPTKSQLTQFFADSFNYDQTDLIAIYEFYHRRTESMQDGRYLMFLSEDIVLLDSPMPYRQLPVFRISPSDIMGTPYGYTPMFDILPIQDSINSLYSTILTNQTAFGVQNIVAPLGTEVNISELSSGMNLIQVDESRGQIRPLNLTQTPEEVFKFLQMLEQTIELISGISAVTRGNAPTNLKTGNALALMQSMTIQFMSGLQQSYVSLVEDVGIGIINCLKDYASVPRVATIVGKNNRSYMKEFTGDDLSSVNRIIVDIGNPMANTTAGRVEMATEMLQMGLIKTPEQYFMVRNTGQLDVMTENSQDQLYLVRNENERLVDGEPVVAIATDDHALHVREHNSVLSDPELRFDPELVQRTLDHIQEHINLLRTVDPDILALSGQQPLGPPGGSPANQPGPQDMEAPEGEPQMEQPVDQAQVPLPEVPTPAAPPPPFEGQPTDPSQGMPQ